MAIPSLVGDNTAKGEKVSGPGAVTVTFEGKPPTLVSADKTEHGETVTGPGAPTVTIEGKVLSVVGDTTTVSVKKNRNEFWGPGPITGPGAGTITVGTGGATPAASPVVVATPATVSTPRETAGNRSTRGGF